MKISSSNYNIAINLNVTEDKDAKSGKTQDTRTIFAGKVRGMQFAPFNKKDAEDDPIATRKAEAVKKAVKILTDARATEEAMDDSMAESANRIEEIGKESEELVKQKAEYQEKIEEFENDPNLTEEEKEEALEPLRERAETFQKQIDANTKAMEAGRKSLEETKIERMKTHKIGNASRQEKKALAAASKDAAYGMMQEGVDKITEKLEKIVEEAKEKKEKEEEEKEAREAVKEKAAAYEKGTKEAEPSKSQVSGGTAIDDEELQRQLQKLKQEELLTDEDLMGIVVDSLL